MLLTSLYISVSETIFLLNSKCKNKKKHLAPKSCRGLLNELTLLSRVKSQLVRSSVLSLVAGFGSSIVLIFSIRSFDSRRRSEDGRSLETNEVSLEEETLVASLLDFLAVMGREILGCAGAVLGFMRSTELEASDEAWLSEEVEFGWCIILLLLKPLLLLMGL